MYGKKVKHVDEAEWEKINEQCKGYKIILLGEGSRELRLSCSTKLTVGASQPGGLFTMPWNTEQCRDKAIWSLSSPLSGFFQEPRCRPATRCLEIFKNIVPRNFQKHCESASKFSKTL